MSAGMDAISDTVKGRSRLEARFRDSLRLIETPKTAVQLIMAKAYTKHRQAFKHSERTKEAVVSEDERDSSTDVAFEVVVEDQHR